MKNHLHLISGLRTLMFLFATFVFTKPILAQTDTLHLIYHHTQNKAHDTTLAHIDRWIKTLKGQHMDITVVGYYPSSNFKPFAQERVDEMFLILNRKARTLFTFGEFTSKKGKDYQRTMVDIIYKPTVTPEEAAAATAKIKADADAAKVADKKKKDDEKAAKEPESKKTKSEVAQEQLEKGDPKEKKTEKGKEKTTDKKGAEKEGGKEGKESDDVDKDVAYSNVVTYGEGIDVSLEEIKYILRAKFIVAQTGKKNIDDNFFEMVKEYWKMNPDIISMPYEEAKKMTKEHKKDTIIIISIAQVKTWFTIANFGYSYKVLKIGRAISMENAKGKTLYKHFIPVDREKGVTIESLAFGVSSMNYILGFMLANKVNKSGDVMFLVDENAKELKNKTLVIAESMKHPKLPVEEISTYYSGKIMWVSDKEAKDVILEQKDFAYVMPVKLPNVAGSYFYYIMDGATGKIYLLDEGPSFQMTMGTGFTKNIDPSQSGYIDKANLQRFEKVIQGDPKLDEKRSDKASKEKEKVEKQEKEIADKKAKTEKAQEEKKAKEEQKKKEKEEKANK